ncbi:MAG: TM2 domain-containing protein [Eubacterium sp.]|nr:TM2 domain-containing protein [Eubacterium sp.]
MFCKNCGKEIDPNAAVCLNCGCAKGTGNSYCQNCGAQTMPGAAICTQCGYALNNASNGFGGSAKSKLVAGLLGIFLGSLGIHNFYLGYTKKAVIQLVISIVGSFLFGLGPIAMGVWGLIEGIQILTGKINTDANGVPLGE